MDLVTFTEEIFNGKLFCAVVVVVVTTKNVKIRKSPNKILAKCKSLQTAKLSIKVFQKNRKLKLEEDN